jgi:hypothetical protein
MHYLGLAGFTQLATASAVLHHLFRTGEVGVVLLVTTVVTEAQ